MNHGVYSGIVVDILSGLLYICDLALGDRGSGPVISTHSALAVEVRRRPQRSGTRG